MAGFDGRLLGGTETERKEGLLFGAVGCWMFCGNQHMDYAKLRGF